MKRARHESSRKACASSSAGASASTSSSYISPGLVWCCYWSLVAQLAARSNGYWYGYGYSYAFAWTPSRSNYLDRLQVNVPLQKHVAFARQQKQKRCLGRSTSLGIGVDIDIDIDIDIDCHVDAEPHEAQSTRDPTAIAVKKSSLNKINANTGARTSTGRVRLPANVASLGITWSSPVSGLGTCWLQPRLRSDAAEPSSLSTSSSSSRSYIDSLKVADLKRACAERGLPKSGNKENLRDRLWKWTTDQNKREKVNITGDFLTRYFEAPTRPEETLRHGDGDVDSSKNDLEPMPNSASVPNSLAEWARTVDLNPLLLKRKEIHRQMREGRPAPQKPKAHMSASHPPLAGTGYLKSLARALRAPSSPYSSNIKVKELYTAAKQADQLGERLLAMDLLQTLLVVTPMDARVVRRLARMYTEQGDIKEAKEILRKALERQQENPWLWHGLGQLERNHGVLQLARDCFAKAIHYDATFAPAYHALGTMEHAQGNVASAMRIIKKGIEFCPSNHRLWHACGCFYRAAQMLEDADRCYRRALNLGPPTSHCFVYSALASVAYEQGDVDRARRWLVKAVEENNGRYAYGWVALSQLEEAENNVKKAQLVCTSAVAQYERGLLEMRSRLLNKKDRVNSTSVELTNQLLHNVPKYRSGDKFVHVYRNWARLEETYGSAEAVDRVYERACTAFPLDFKLLITWAQYHQKNMNHRKARELFRRARITVGHRHADPFRISAEMEMSLSNFQGARGMLRFGAQAVLSHSQLGSDTTDGRGLPLLLHTWAICEWHLGNLDRAEALFAQALRLSARKQFAAGIRSFILYSIARFKHYRGELHLAQHCIGLIMKENVFPGGLARVWALWAEIARDMKNPRLEEECVAKAALARNGHGTSTSTATKNYSDSLFESRLALEYTRSGTETMLNKDPWYIKLFGVGSQDTSALFKHVKFPAKKPDKGMKTAGQ